MRKGVDTSLKPLLPMGSRPSSLVTLATSRRQKAMALGFFDFRPRTRSGAYFLDG